MKIISADTLVEEKVLKDTQLQQQSLLRKSMTNVYEETRGSLLDQQGLISSAPSKDTSQSNVHSYSNVTENFTANDNNFVLDGELLTLRVLFIDILLIICALISDFVQATSILSENMKNHEHLNWDIKYALAAYAIIWLPGIPAAIHYLSVFRHKLVWYKSLSNAFLIILFYPFVPIVAKLVLIWIKPKDNKLTKDFMVAEYGAAVAYAIHGCISAPIQLCYQTWLVLNGIVRLKFDNLVLDLSDLDWGVNEGRISWPSTALCLFFSILT